MSFNVKNMKQYIKSDMNVFISGERGTAKTQITKKALNDMGVKYAYFSTPTFDPYVEVMGVPVPRIEEGKKAVLEFVKVARMDDVEVIVLDELNRASSETLNMVFEVIDEGTVNGSRLGNVKNIVAMVNPNNGNYIGVSDLDPALLDRFDLFLESSTAADLAYMESVFGKDIAYELVKWHRSHMNNSKNDYISPRRLEKIGSNWMKIKTRAVIDATLPPGVSAATNALHIALKNAAEPQLKKISTGKKIVKKRQIPVVNGSVDLNSVDNSGISIKKIVSPNENSRSSIVNTTMTKDTINTNDEVVRLGNIVYNYDNMHDQEVREKISRIEVAFENAVNAGDVKGMHVLISLALRSYKYSVSASTIFSKIEWAFMNATNAQLKVYMSSVTAVKRAELWRTAKNNYPEIYKKIVVA